MSAIVDIVGREILDSRGNPMLRAYQGSVEAMQGREALLPWKKMKYTENGLATPTRRCSNLPPSMTASWYAACR